MVTENIQAIVSFGISTFGLPYDQSDRGGKDVHKLVIMDHFMQHVQALITSSQTAKYTAQALWYRFVVH